jgi:hypothetical protein
MDEFFKEMQDLRDSVENRRVFDCTSTDDWNTLCASMDALEDTHHAILAFVSAASNLLPKLQERELGERYLRTYGVMQAFAIQQDAIRNIHLSLGMPDPDLSPLDHIREFRIAAAGHPTLQDRPKALPRRAHFISQPTLGDSGMDLLTVDGSGQPLFRSVQIPSLADEQEKHILRLIRQAVSHFTWP